MSVDNEVECVVMKKLLTELLPEMEARLSGLRKLWPDRQVLLNLHRNERLVTDIKRAVCADT